MTHNDTQYKIVQSYASRKENEFEIYHNHNRIAYFVQDNASDECEIYHNANEDFSEYASIDYCTDFDCAVQFVLNQQTKRD
jgi:hypothetical protein